MVPPQKGTWICVAHTMAHVRYTIWALIEGLELELKGVPLVGRCAPCHQRRGHVALDSPWELQALPRLSDNSAVI